LFQIVGFKIYSLPTSALKSPFKMFIEVQNREEFMWEPYSKHHCTFPPVLKPGINILEAQNVTRNDAKF
jgi:hypothetical protein